MNNHLIAYAILFIIILFLLNSVLTKSPKAATATAGGGGSGWKVYGTNGCGWTRKQLEVMDEKKVSHQFIDCDQDSGSCTGMTGFPTLVDPDGNKTVGFKQF